MSHETQVYQKHYETLQSLTVIAIAKMYKKPYMPHDTPLEDTIKRFNSL